MPADRLAREASIKARLEAEGAESAHELSLGRREKAEAVYRERLHANCLTEEGYQSHKMWIPTIDADTENAEEYGRKLDFARTGKDKAEEAIAGSEQPVLSPLETSLQEAEEAQKGETDNRAKIGARLTHLRNLQSEIEGTLELILACENETAPLRALSALFNADNPLRLDLETYAIGAMFDHVLAAANLRLGPMTNGRYSLARENDGSGGRSRAAWGSTFSTFTPAKGGRRRRFLAGRRSSRRWRWRWRWRWACRT